ncbi:RebB family R body protein [Robbsia andropogonis]|uniref:RebB family R body protein n=1 Tax=Robbsia andropogonis TaxID=28092 RepID=UPI001F3C6325|nr:RebB family R body protein [Robbsia andropogonis]MCP1118971.1 RebB family R body protein [Robbsia andropogonis]MCP1128677.1 RebB family R body protein [Robbsia andropogonis]
MAHSTGILFENAVSAQQQQDTLTQAASNRRVMQIYSMDMMAGAAGTEKVSQGGSRTTSRACLLPCKRFKTVNAPRALNIPR